MRTDCIDYPTAFEVQNSSTLDHDPNCSFVAAGFMLCDCEAMPLEWARRVAELEPDRAEWVNEFVKEYLPGPCRTPKGEPPRRTRLHGCWAEEALDQLEHFDGPTCVACGLSGHRTHECQATDGPEHSDGGVSD